MTDSVVFADDNPAERHIVASSLPSTAVPEMEGVENYIRILDRNAYFEVTSLSADDLRRNEMYKENARAKQSGRALRIIPIIFAP